MSELQVMDGLEVEDRYKDIPRLEVVLGESPKPHVEHISVKRPTLIPQSSSTPILDRLLTHLEGIPLVHLVFIQP